nr:response regulator [Flavobacteriales bacterium]
YFSIDLGAIWDSNHKFKAISIHLRNLNFQKASKREIKYKTGKVEKLKDIFIANMNHELRTPVNLIIGFSDILLQKNLEEKQQKDYIQTIRMVGENILKVINSMLDSSKIEAGKMIFEEIPFSISKTFLSLEKMFSEKAKQKNIYLRFHCHTSIPSLIIGDPTRFTQILTNLISNAIKFTDQGKVLIFGRIIVEKNQEKFLQISVEDTGIGIDKDLQAFLFERYRQAEINITRNYGGSGLGLSIVKNLVELQNGSISFKSEMGAGSTFTFKLPLKTNVKNIVEIEKEILAEDILTNENKLEILRKLKILMVEDNKLNVKMMTHIFLMQNISLEIAANGVEAVEKVKNKYFDIILMDIEMPLMKGCKATQIIRKELKNNTPIIALTANSLAWDKEKYIKKGMNGYITKPVDINHLFTNMYELISSK